MCRKEVRATRCGAGGGGAEGPSETSTAGLGQDVASTLHQDRTSQVRGKKEKSKQPPAGWGQGRQRDSRNDSTQTTRVRQTTGGRLQAQGP